MIDGIIYVWVKIFEYYGNGVGRIKNIFIFMWKLRMNYKKVVDKYKLNVVIVFLIYFLDIYLVYRIVKRCNSKFFFEIYDLWLLSFMEIGGYFEKNFVIVIF